VKRTTITIETVINAPLSVVWHRWTTPEDIIHWNNASDDWHTPHAKNDLRVGGKYDYRMEAKDGSMGFDFWGIYNAIVKHERINSTLGDGRKVHVSFSTVDGKTKVVETFEAESSNPIDLQRTGWQAILDNFKKYVEAQA